ncbi:hypothetical protein A3F66_02515 [candidate division TM6 bacterium RIFCSPHIGHO2_12_FULL_32_22]|nr:MAG: hypothetical protein A3F66_02515 [candidate division TM6 bacterium RIFCSPHIGHO2_12_FULL_32_22]
MRKYLLSLMVLVSLHATPERYQSQPSKMAKVRQSIRFAKEHPDQSNLIGGCCVCLPMVPVVILKWITGN